MEPDRDHRGGEEVEPPRPRRGRLPDRHEVELHPQGLDRAQVPRDQRGRGRAGHLQGPLPPRARSPRPDRGHDHRGARDRLARRVRLHPGRVRAAVADLQRRGARRPTTRGCSARTSRARASTSTSWSTAGAGAYICGEETGLLSSLEGKKGWPKIKPPFPAVKGAFGQPDHREQRGDASRRCPTSSTGAPSGSPASAPRRRAGTRLYSVSGHVVKPGRGGGAGVGDPALAHLRPLRRHPRRAAAQGGGARRLLGADPHRRRDRRDHGRRRPQDGRHHDRLGGRDRDGRDGRRSRRRSWWWRASTPTSRAGSARPAASPPAGSTR